MLRSMVEISLYIVIVRQPKAGISQNSSNAEVIGVRLATVWGDRKPRGGYGVPQNSSKGEVLAGVEKHERH